MSDRCYTCDRRFGADKPARFRPEVCSWCLRGEPTAMEPTPYAVEFDDTPVTQKHPLLTLDDLEAFAAGGS